MNDSVEITHWVVKFILIYSDFNYTYAFLNHTNAILMLSQEGFKSGRKPPRVKEMTVLLSLFFFYFKNGEGAILERCFRSSRSFLRFKFRAAKYTALMSHLGGSEI